MVRYVIGVVAIVLALALAEPTAAQQIRAGLLTCDVSAGIGLIIMSQKQVSCAFKPDQPGRQEDYDGTITKYGLDLGVTGGGVMMWAVLTNTGAGPGLGHWVRPFPAALMRMNDRFGSWLCENATARRTDRMDL